MDDFQLAAVVEAHRVEGGNMKKNRGAKALSRSFPFLSFSNRTLLIKQRQSRTDRRTHAHGHASSTEKEIRNFRSETESCSRKVQYIFFKRRKRREKSWEERDTWPWHRNKEHLRFHLFYILLIFFFFSFADSLPIINALRNWLPLCSFLSLFAALVFVCLFVCFLLHFPSFLQTSFPSVCSLRIETEWNRKKEEEEDDDDEMKRNHLRRSLPLYCFHYVNKTRGHLSGSCQRTRDEDKKRGKRIQLGGALNKREETARHGNEPKLSSVWKTNTRLESLRSARSLVRRRRLQREPIFNYS